MGRGAVLALFFLAWISAALALAVGDPAPSFRLPRWPEGPDVGLNDFPGEILVLDFFAYWCAPCRRASAELEEGIQRHYEQTRGNAHGLPVRVISINIEPEQPEKTAAFLRETKSRLVVNDFSGTVLRRYGGEAIPFFVVLDGSQATPDNPAWKLAYRHAGYEGLAKLRAVIDAIRAPDRLPQAIASEPPRRAPTFLQAWLSGASHLWEANFDGLKASDVLVTDTAAAYRFIQHGAEGRLSLAYGTYDVDFKAPDAAFQDNEVHQDRIALQTGLRWNTPPSLTWLASGGVYEGYTDFRSVWLDEYYRQLFGPDPMYEEADPGGYNVSAGVRWEYKPATGFLQLEGGYNNDVVSPGYEPLIVIDPPNPPRFLLRRGRDTLDTYFGRLTFENVLSRRVRALNEFIISDTTDRETRYTYQGSLNWSPAEHWVVRSILALTTEKPQLDAVSFGTTLEYDWDGKWFLSLQGRYYQDTGQVESQEVISSATPAVRTWQVGLGLRWQGRRASFKLIAGPYISRYDSVGPDSRDFAHLYRDRDWLFVQAGFGYAF